MNEIESMTRQLGDAFGPKWLGAATHKTGEGFMLWDDDDHCIFAEFYGNYDAGDKIKLSATLIEAHQSLCISYSLRIGFHPTEEVAQRTMMGWWGEK